MAWMLHHINVPALDVRETKAFLRDVIGLQEGRWIYPDRPGELHHNEDSIAYFGTANQGLHVVRSVPSFARDNGFMHNPTVGGHFAISVPDLSAVKDKLDASGVPYSDAGVYAMAGIHQIYVYDPTFNVIEINQTVEPLPSAKLEDQAPTAEILLRQATIPAQDLEASTAFFRDLIGGDAPSVKADGTTFRSGDHALRLTHVTSGYGNGKSADPASREPSFTLAVPDLAAVKTRLDQQEIPNSGRVPNPVDGVDSLFVHAPSLRLMAVVQS
jgi:catechol 2,3-dioxygenase-like lactoylglutathione lyase family enzyme